MIYKEWIKAHQVSVTQQLEDIDLKGSDDFKECITKLRAMIFVLAKEIDVIANAIGGRS